MAQTLESHLAAYRREGDWWLLEVRLRDTRQMFEALDPAPFREKDLDPGAEEYLVEAIKDIGISRRVRLRIHLAAAAVDSAAARSLPDAVAHHFEYRTAQARSELRRMLGRGATSLAIGLVFLSLCLSVRGTMVGEPRYAVLAEGLLIIGWVGLWRPVEIFLYDWWPVLRRQRQFAALARMPVEVVTDAI